jgi:hypothetical protein
MNEQLTSGRVTSAIRRYEQQEEAQVPTSPPIEHSPIDPSRQTGDSRLLGGEMRMRAPWVEDPPDSAAD